VAVDVVAGPAQVHQQVAWGPAGWGAHGAQSRATGEAASSGKRRPPTVVGAGQTGLTYRWHGTVIVPPEIAAA